MESDAHNSHPPALPAGVHRRPLSMHRDTRGAVTEVFRREWDLGVMPVQWNAVHSHPGSLRGFHVHLSHQDYLVLVRGEMQLGLKDLRKNSPTFGLSALLTLREERLEGWVIPPGVGHGFYLPVESVFFYSVSEYWRLDGELGCRWNDPALGLAWPVAEPLLSERDQKAGSLEELLARLDGHSFPHPP